MSLVQIKMHLGIIKKGGFFFSSFPAAVPQHKPFVSGKKFKNVNPVFAPVGYTASPVGTTFEGDLEVVDLADVDLTDSWICNPLLSGENIGSRVQSNKLKAPHVRTKKYNPEKLHSKSCGAPQNSDGLR